MSRHATANPKMQRPARSTDLPFWLTMIGIALLAMGLLFAVAGVAYAAPPSKKSKPGKVSISDYYTLKDIKLPDTVVGEIGGLSFLPNGKLAVCFYREGVWFYDPSAKEENRWTHFALGLHEPLGIHAVSEREVVVIQRPELTRLIDTDGDGRADEFKPITTAFGMSGNYHEFAFGIAADKDGNYFIALNTASNGAGTFKEVRGPFKALGRPGRMYACVPYRGWVLRVSPDGKVTPWASGFRSPNGLGFDAKGNLFVTDNQGDWVGTSPLHHVRKGGFHGHVTSLVWRKDWDPSKDPLKLPVEDILKLRLPPAVVYPHGAVANSPTQPVCDTTGGKFGPYAGQMLVGDMNQRRIIRNMLEEVDGQLQGAAISLIQGSIIKNGINRMAFAPDHSLWVGHTRRARGWTGNTGLTQIKWTGKTPMDLLSMKLTERGFKLRFTKPLDKQSASDPASYGFRRYFYAYHRGYGSKQYDVTNVPVTKAEVSADGREVTLTLPEVKPGYVYELKMTGLASDAGEPALNDYAAYNVNRLLDGTAGYPQLSPEFDAMKKAANAKGKKSASKKPTVTGPTTAVALGNDAIRFDVQQIRRFGPSKQTKNPGHSGKGYLDFGSSPEEWIEVTVNTKQATTATLTVRYAVAGNGRPLKLVVNGKNATTLPFAGGRGWSDWREQEATMSLPQGKSTIRLHATTGGGPNIDWLTISPPPKASPR